MKQKILRYKKLMFNKPVQVEVPRKKIAVIKQRRHRRRRLSHHEPHRFRHWSGQPRRQTLQKLHKNSHFKTHFSLTQKYNEILTIDIDQMS